MEFGERVHFEYKKQVMANKLEHRWGLWFSGEAILGEAILGTPQGIEKAGTIKRIGAH